MFLLNKFKEYFDKSKYSVLMIIFALGLLAGFLIFSAFQNKISYSIEEPVIQEPMDKEDQTANSPATSSQGVVRRVVSSVSQMVNLGSKDNESITEPVKLGAMMAWIYPGTPACGASIELADGRNIDVLKPEYFRIDEGGALTFLEEENHGCNGFSKENVTLIKIHSKEQYVTVASSEAGPMGAFLKRDISTGEHTKTLIDFVVQNEFEGVEIDFEDFGGWDEDVYENYKTFVTNLGDALHAQDKKLMIDGPAISNKTEESWFVWRYSDFISLPVDYIVIMAYDHQFDHGVGVPVSPLAWIEKVIAWTLSKFHDKSRLVVGIPSYGYYGTIGGDDPKIITYDEAKQFPGFETATRDEKSGEMIWRSGDNFYVYQDSESLKRKMDIVLNQGINSISIWHLGGNNWLK